MKIKVLTVFFLFFFVLNTQSYAEISTFKVLKIVDGDTIQVDVRGNKETVRLLGIDTPETVDPRKSVQCFGKSASDKMKALVGGKSVILVDEGTHGNRDKYKRLLRYVYLPDSVKTFVNGEMVKQGYAFSYRQYPTKNLDRFNIWEKYAREHSLGLWGSCPINQPTKNTQIQPTKATTSSGSTYAGGDKDCSDFATHAKAQAYFIGKGGSPTNNVDRL